MAIKLPKLMQVVEFSTQSNSHCIAMKGISQLLHGKRILIINHFDNGDDRSLLKPTNLRKKMPLSYQAISSIMKSDKIDSILLCNSNVERTKTWMKLHSMKEGIFAIDNKLVSDLVPHNCSQAIYTDGKVESMLPIVEKNNILEYAVYLGINSSILTLLGIVLIVPLYALLKLIKMKK